MKQVIHKNIESIELEPTSHFIGSKKVLLKESDCESMLTQAAIGYLEKGQFVDNHAHPTMIEYYYFINGKAKFTIENSEYLCKENTFIKIPKNSIHSLVAITSTNFIYWGIAI